MKKWTIFTVLCTLAALAVAFNSCSKGDKKAEQPTPVKTVGVAAQSGTLITGTAGTVTFAVTTANIADGKSGTVAWFTTVAGTTAGSAPAGVSATVSAVSSNSAIVTVGATTEAADGSYYFKVTIDGTTSAVAVLTVNLPELVFADNEEYDIPATRTVNPITDIDVALGVSGGKAPYTFSATGLPAGISIASSTGVISGTPTAAVEAGTATITVTDAASTAKSITIGYGQIVVPSVEITKQNTVVVAGAASQPYFSVKTENIDPGDYVVEVAGLPVGVTVGNSGSVTISATGSGTLYLSITATAALDSNPKIRLTIDGVTSEEFTMMVDRNFTEGGIYYIPASPGSTDVKVTNMFYRDDWSTDITNSYSGAVTIPSTVTHNGTTYPVKEIGLCAFYQSSGLTSVTLPASITRLNSRAFAGCTNLTSIDLPEGLAVIGAYAFNQCPKLATLLIPASVTEINSSNSVFEGCYNLTLSVAAGGTFSVTDDVLFEKSDDNAKYYLRWIPEKKTGEYTIPDEVKVIRKNATNYGKLKKLTIPAGVEEIIAGNFHSCTSLQELTLNWPNPSACKIDTNYLGSYFYGVTGSNVTLKVPAGKVAIYEAHPLWGAKGFKIEEQ